MENQETAWDELLADLLSHSEYTLVILRKMLDVLVFFLVDDDCTSNFEYADFLPPPHSTKWRADVNFVKLIEYSFNSIAQHISKQDKQ